MTDARRAIPSVEKLLASPEMQSILDREPRARVVEVLRQVLADVRDNGANAHDIEWYAAQTGSRLQQMHSTSLRSVINGTGVILHTNLGRAPLSEAALRAIANVARDYSNLEYDLDKGSRGSRYDHCTQFLREVTGAESALVVNNNAAALVLALNTFAANRDAIVSRGELVEIGGSFRIPDIMQRSGARLVEVGATNRTHLRDYMDAFGPDMGAVLKVHRSNFEMSGYVSEVSARELAATVEASDAVVIHDLGSGLLEDLSEIGLTGEPTAREAVRALPGGIVTLSGDKLLGGPQAGILLGSAAHIERMKKNPLCRALRVDKLTLAALAETLRAYANGTAQNELPVLRMLHLSSRDIEARAGRVTEQLAASGVEAAIEQASSSVGGGAFPNAKLPTHLVVIESTAASQVEARLRAAERPVIVRIVNDRVAIDLRTVRPEDETYLVSVLVEAVRG